MIDIIIMVLLLIAMNKKACILGATGLVGSGKEIWTKYYWKSRIAAKGEIKIGKTIIAFNDNREDDIYYAPENKEGARTDSWFMAKITDTTDMYKGYVMVSGGYKVAIDNIRIPLK